MKYKKKKTKIAFRTVLIVVALLNFMIYHPLNVYATTGRAQPTSFTDDINYWSNEANAYDINNGTYAELTTADDNADLDLHTFNNSLSGTINQVDIYIYTSWTFTGNDYITMKWYVSASQGSGTHTCNNGNNGDNQLITFIDVTEPINSVWDWTDISNLLIEFDCERLQGDDLTYFRIMEVWVMIDYTAVSDSTPPVLTSPSDDNYNEGSTGNTISWTVTELNPDTYEVFCNSSPWDSGSYSNGVPIVIDIDGKGAGIWNFTIYVNDTSGNSAVDMVIIEVFEIDIDDPTITNPPDYSYNFSTTGHNILWNATDENPYMFYVYRNGSLYDSGSYTNDTFIDVDIDGLNVGMWNFTVYVNDTFGNFITDLVFILVNASISEFPSETIAVWRYILLHPQEHLVGIFIFTVIIGFLAFILVKRRRN